MFQLNLRKTLLIAAAAAFSATGLSQAEAKVTVRDHRTTIVVKDHRSDQQRPVIRDHRTERTEQGSQQKQ